MSLSLHLPSAYLPVSLSPLITRLFVLHRNSTVMRHLPDRQPRWPLGSLAVPRGHYFAGKVEWCASVCKERLIDRLRALNCQRIFASIFSRTVRHSKPCSFQSHVEHCAWVCRAGAFNFRVASLFVLDGQQIIAIASRHFLSICRMAFGHLLAVFSNWTN